MANDLELVTRQLDIAIHALQRIYQPVRYMVEDCPPDCKIDIFCIQRIAEDPAYYQQTAGEALGRMCNVVAQAAGEEGA